VLSGDRSHLTAAVNLLEQVDPGEEPQMAGWITNLLARAAFLEGDPARAHQLSLAVPEKSLLPELDVWIIPTWSAMRLRDPELLESAWREAPAGRRFDAIAKLHHAASVHLSGDVALAESLFEPAIAAIEAADGNEMAMITRALYAELASERPPARDAAAVAHAWFTEVGANGYLRLFHDVWPLTLDRAEAG
jgi:hypothetical protein